MFFSSCATYPHWLAPGCCCHCDVIVIVDILVGVVVLVVIVIVTFGCVLKHLSEAFQRNANIEFDIKISF